MLHLPFPPRPSYVQGQPGGNLPSGNQSEDALDYLLNGLYTTTAGNADNPLEEEDRYDDADNDADGGGGAGKQDDAGASSPEQIEVGRGAEQQDEEGAIETLESKADGSPGGGGGIKEEPDHGDNRDRGDDDSSEDREDAEGGFPDRPNNWIHPFLLTYCLIGRPSSSEDPDLKTARKTSGPKGRKGKLKSKQGSLNTSEKSGPKAHGAYTEVDLSSSAIRMFTGAGDSRSRVQVKETPAVAAANAQAQARRIQETNSGKLIAGVEALSAAVVSRQALDQEAAARVGIKRKIDDLRGQLEFTEPGKEEMELRARLGSRTKCPPATSWSTPRR